MKGFLEHCEKSLSVWGVGSGGGTCKFLLATASLCGCDWWQANNKPHELFHLTSGLTCCRVLQSRCHVGVWIINIEECHHRFHSSNGWRHQASPVRMVLYRWPLSLEPFLNHKTCRLGFFSSSWCKMLQAACAEIYFSNDGGPSFSSKSLLDRFCH